VHATALVDDRRRDASDLWVLAERGRLAISRRSVSTVRPILLDEGALIAHR